MKGAEPARIKGTRFLKEIIGLVYKNEVHYITQIEDFRDFMEPQVYETMQRALDSGIGGGLQSKYDDLKLDYESLQGEYDDLERECDCLRDELEDAEKSKDDFDNLKVEHESLQCSIRNIVNSLYHRYLKTEDIIPELERLV